MLSYKKEITIYKYDAYAKHITLVTSMLTAVLLVMPYVIITAVITSITDVLRTYTA